MWCAWKSRCVALQLVKHDIAETRSTCESLVHMSSNMLSLLYAVVDQLDLNVDLQTSGEPDRQFPKCDGCDRQAHVRIPRPSVKPRKDPNLRSDIDGLQSRRKSMNQG